MNIAPDQALTREQIKEIVSNVFSEHVPFNKVIGVTLGRFDEDTVEVHFPIKPELIGNKMQNILHGGVTATVLDTVGGLLATHTLFKDEESVTFEELRNRTSKIGTIDMRVDFLRPGRGEHFTASAQIIRQGNKVAVCRMELHNDEGVQIAYGTGTYMVG